MSKKFSLLLVLAIVLVSLTSVSSAAPIKRSQSAIMIDAASGKVISASNADERRYPASLTKLMTLYIAFDALDKGKLKLSDKLKVSRNAANRAPSKIGVRAGETISVETTIKALIIKSANDCATVLAEALGKTEENFAKIMTKTAQDLRSRYETYYFQKCFRIAGSPTKNNRSRYGNLSQCCLSSFSRILQLVFYDQIYL